MASSNRSRTNGRHRDRRTSRRVGRPSSRTDAGPHLSEARGQQTSYPRCREGPYSSTPRGILSTPAPCTWPYRILEGSPDLLDFGRPRSSPATSANLMVGSWPVQATPYFVHLPPMPSMLPAPPMRLHQEPEQGPRDDDERQNRGDEVAQHAHLLDIRGPTLSEITVPSTVPAPLRPARRCSRTARSRCSWSPLPVSAFFLGVVILQLKADDLLELSVISA